MKPLHGPVAVSVRPVTSRLGSATDAPDSFRVRAEGGRQGDIFENGGGFTIETASWWNWAG